MQELLWKLDGGQVIAIVAVTGGLLIAAVSVITGAWVRIRQTEATAALKQDMLNRGMSAEEIRSVIEAGAKGRCGR
jgi:hypothetical protein